MARGNLTKESIQRAALAIVDSSGLESLSIRSLAAALGVTPMAIYRHYPNKAAIELDLVDLVVGDFAVTSHSKRKLDIWLLETFLRMRNGLCRHPGIIGLLERGLYTGPNAITVMEEVIGRLRKSGMEEGDALQLFYTLISFTIGSVVLGNASKVAAELLPQAESHADEVWFRRGVEGITSLCCFQRD